MLNIVIIALIGPSASGKSSLADRLAATGAVRVVPTYTTRPRRAGETTCLNHVFCSDAEFDARLAAGEIVAAGQLSGLPYRYGLPVLTPDTAPTLVIVRARHVATLVDLGLDPVVYQLEASPEICRQRLAIRSTSAAEARTRDADHADEISRGRSTAHRVFTNRGSLDQLAAAVSKAIRHDRKEAAA